MVKTTRTASCGRKVFSLNTLEKRYKQKRNPKNATQPTTAELRVCAMSIYLQNETFTLHNIYVMHDLMLV